MDFEEHIVDLQNDQPPAIQPVRKYPTTVEYGICNGNPIFTIKGKYSQTLSVEQAEYILANAETIDKFTKNEEFNLSETICLSTFMKSRVLNLLSNDKKETIFSAGAVKCSQILDHHDELTRWVADTKNQEPAPTSVVVTLESLCKVFPQAQAEKIFSLLIKRN
jgi:hypothetical protein